MASSFITFFFGAFLLIGTTLASDKKKEWLEDLSQDVQEIPDFKYSELDQWGDLHPSFAVCSSGKRQSPIDIDTYEVIVNNTLQPLNREYSVSNAKLCTEGTHIEVVFEAKGGLEIDGKKYELAQMHFHTPSEHQLNGVRYAAELHQVHKAADGSRAVVGILFKYGLDSPLLDTIMPQLQELGKKPCSGHQQSSIIKDFNVSYLRKWPRNYYRYPGSLTTPPCDENVIWSVLSEAKTISRRQVDALRTPLCDDDKLNARPPQDLNGRKVHKYEGN